MDKSALVEEYVAYMIKVGRTTDAGDPDIPTDELDIAISACELYTNWSPFLCFNGVDDDETTETLVSPAYLIFPSFGIQSLSSFKLDGNEISSDYYTLINPDKNGLMFGVKLDQCNYMVDESTILTLTGYFGKLLELTKFEKLNLFKMANALSGNDPNFNSFMTNPDVTKMSSGSQSVTFNRSSLSADSVLKLFSFFGDFKTILLKYKRMRFK